MPRNFLFGLLLILPGAAFAATADFDQEIKIIAKRQASDLKNKIASYLEDVKITQGSLSIEADLVQVSNQGDTDNKVYLAKGKPAIFSQILDDGQKIELTANEISYSPSTSTIVIKGNASINQEGSRVSGDIITYNIATEQLTAESTSSVTTILQPETKAVEQDDSAKALEPEVHQQQATELQAEAKEQEQDDSPEPIDPKPSEEIETESLEQKQ